VTAPELILDQLTQLPTLPAVAVKLLEATTNKQTNADDLVRLIESDAALVAKIVGMTRKANLGVRQEVPSVERAVVLLGFTAVRNAVLSIQLYETFAGLEQSHDPAMVGSDHPTLARNEFWRHSLAVACCAQTLAQRMVSSAHPTAVQPDEAFVCGLLHDIGKLALNACLPKSYARVIRECDTKHRCITDVERDILGLDHTIAGKRLVSHWRLPQPIVECVWLHHQSFQALPRSITSSDLVRVVHVADELVRRHKIGYSGFCSTGTFEADIGQLGIEPDAIADIVGSLFSQLEQFAELVGLDNPIEETDYARCLWQANMELSHINTELAASNRSLEHQSRFFQTLVRFTRALGAGDRPQRVGEIIAEVMAKLVRGNAAMVYTLPLAGRPLAGRVSHLSLWTCGGGCRSQPLAGGAFGERGEPHPGTSVPDRITSGAPVAPASLGPPRICVANQNDVELWHRIDSGDAKGIPYVLSAGCALNVLPIIHGGEVFGRVVFSANPSVVEPLMDCATECESLSAAFGLALANAADLSASDQMSEELVELNRRLESAGQKLLRRRTLSMIAQMAAGAAHELNNPLAVISGRAQLLARDLVTDEQTVKSLTIISDQTRRASDIITELMQFAKPDPPQPHVFALADLLEDVRKHWSSNYPITGGTHAEPAPSQFQIHLSDPNVTLYVDRDLIFDTINALVSNALEAINNPQNGRLLINCPSCRTDEIVRIRIEDNGVGMTGCVLERAFDPFYSSRPAGRGRGLGLSKAQRAVEISGGRLWLESTPDVGTTAYLELPTRAPLNSE